MITFLRPMLRGRPAVIPAPSRVDVGSVWQMRGDSHAAGRETEPTAVSPMHCFQIIYEDSGYSAPTTVVRDGVSGCSLQATNIRYTSEPLANTSFGWFQESGNQNKTGQATTQEFQATLLSFLQEFYSDHPLAVLLYETAYSFRRENQEYRNWTPYNAVLLSVVQMLAAQGQTVLVSDTNAIIERLVIAMGYDNVCFPDAHLNAYHFQAPGNLAIALGVFNTLNYDIQNLNMSGINVSTTIKNQCISAVLN